ncbi:MAG: hypothetical protein Fur0043_17300 [Anaerolineales bacterium]
MPFAMGLVSILYTGLEGVAVGTEDGKGDARLQLVSMMQSDPTMILIVNNKGF